MLFRLIVRELIKYKLSLEKYNQLNRFKLCTEVFNWLYFSRDNLCFLRYLWTSNLKSTVSSDVYKGGSCDGDHVILQVFTQLFESCNQSLEQQRVAVRATVLIGEWIHFVSSNGAY